MKIVTYSGQQADFYILNKGLNAGKPSRTPFRNSFAVFCEGDSFLFERVHVLFIGRYFERYIHGTAIPTIRLNDVKEVITETPVKSGIEAEKKLQAINDIEKLLTVTEKKIKLLKELKVAVARQLTTH